MKTKRVLATSVSFGVVFFCYTAFADALDNWHWRHPLPTANSLYGVTFGNGLFVAVDGVGLAWSSTNGADWSSVTVTANRLNAVTYAGGLFIAVGNNGDLETSSDGTSWTRRMVPTTATLNSVAYGNGTFVAVGATGIILSSTNASEWFLRSSPTSSTLTGVAYGNGNFVAIGSSIIRSSDGITWTSQPPFATHTAIVFGSNKFVIGSTCYCGQFPYAVSFSSMDGSSWTTNSVPAVLYGLGFRFITFANGLYLGSGLYPNVPGIIFISTDGNTWTNATLSGYTGGHAGAYGNGTFVVVGNAGSILTSTNGLAWTNRSAGPRTLLTAIVSGNGVDVAVGGEYVGAPGGPAMPPITVLRSTNGEAYVTQFVSTTNQSLSSVVHASGAFVAVGTGGTILRSVDGITWTQRNSGTFNILHFVTAGNGLLVAVGDNGTIQTSPNGLVWTSRFSGTSYHLYGATFGNGMFVVVGYLGTVLTSVDGISWAAQDSGQLSHLFSVVGGSLGFIAVGESGTIVTSPDGINWTSQNSGTLLRLNSVSYGNGYYVAVASPTAASGLSGNVTLTSVDGVVWTARNTGVGDASLYGTAFINNRFFLVGGNGAILESDSTATMPLSLQIQRVANTAKLNIFAPLGSTFHLQVCMDLAGSNWSDSSGFTNVLAVTQWTDPETNLWQRFYRAVSP